VRVSPRRRGVREVYQTARVIDLREQPRLPPPLFALEARDHPAERAGADVSIHRRNASRRPPPAPARSVRFASASRRLRRATLGEPVERARRRRPIIIIIIIADRRSPHHRECVRHRNSRAPRARGSLEAGATLLGWALRRARIFDEGAFPLDGCWRARPAFKCADFAFTAGVGGGGRRGGFVGVSFRSTRRDPPWGGGAWSADASLVRRDERRETLTRRALSFISRSRADGSGRPTCSTRATARLLAPRLRPRARGCTATVRDAGDLCPALRDVRLARPDASRTMGREVPSSARVRRHPDGSCFVSRTTRRIHDGSTLVARPKQKHLIGMSPRRPPLDRPSTRAPPPPPHSGRCPALLPSSPRATPVGGAAPYARVLPARRQDGRRRGEVRAGCVSVPVRRSATNPAAATSPPATLLLPPTHSKQAASPEPLSNPNARGTSCRTSASRGAPLPSSGSTPSTRVASRSRAPPPPSLRTASAAAAAATTTTRSRARRCG